MVSSSFNWDFFKSNLSEASLVQETSLGTLYGGTAGFLYGGFQSWWMTGLLKDCLAQGARQGVLYGNPVSFSQFINCFQRN